MKRWHLFALLLLLGSAGIMAAMAYSYYAPPHQRQPYATKHHHDDTLRIAYIGDSWAYMHKEYDERMARMMEDRLQRPVKVMSYGICGLTSKEIYDSLFDDPSMNSFMKQGYHFCFISAGINDTYKKMCTTYYQKSMSGLVGLMTANHIHPVILEIPDYDILKTYERQKRQKKLLRRLSMLLTGTPIDCKQMFRKALLDMKYQEASIVRYQEWNSRFTDDLKTLYQQDGMHLNADGYARLDSCIAKHICAIASANR